MAEAYDLADLVTTRLVGQPGYGVHRGVVLTTPLAAYVVLYFGGGAPTGARLDGQARRLRWSFRAVCAGRSDAQALETVDRVRARLAGWRPLPDQPSAGRLVEADLDAPLIRDDSVPNDVRYSVTLTFTLYTTDRS